MRFSTCILLHGWLMFLLTAYFFYMLSNFSQPHLGIETGPQADEQSETNHTAKKEDITCTCSSLYIQGRLTHKYSHRCTQHNDTLEHDCTSKNTVPGLIVPSDERLDTPQPVEDQCICSSLHIHGSSVNVCYYHRCPVHNDTVKHDCTHDNIVNGKSNFVQFDKLPETPLPVEDACICSTLHIQGKAMQKYYNRCPVHNDTEEHTDYTRRNIVIGQGQ